MSVSPARNRRGRDCTRWCCARHRLGSKPLRVDQPVFDALKERFGEPWVVELTGLIGHYGLVSGLLNAFEMAPPADAEQLPVSR